jgi:hypothetical protein
MKKSIAILAASAVVLLLVAVYLWGPSKVPPGQQPLLVLSEANFTQFEEAFDQHADSLRLVVLLSPT